MTYPKRLIEVDLPIKEISAHARREKSIRHGHISTLHIWWARRPLAACRAVICAALWPDPLDDNCPQAFRDAAAKILCAFAEKARTEKRVMELVQNHYKDWNRTTPANMNGKKATTWAEMRLRLLDFIADFANWDASTVPEFLETARALTQAAHEALGGAPGTRPLVVDPFAGGGSIPLEALRVGADAFASDLNPVAVLLNKVVLEYIPKYGNAEIAMKDADGKDRTFHGLAEAVRYWGNWIKELAEKELAEFYPKDPDGSTPIAYLWARTIKCEGPGCGTDVPLIRSLWLARKGRRSVALRLIPDKKRKRVDWEIVENAKAKEVAAGTAQQGSATCPVCGYTTPVKSVREQFKKRHGGAADARLLCVVSTKLTEQGRFYRMPTERDRTAIKKATQELDRRKVRHTGPLSLVPDEKISFNELRRISVPLYGMMTWGEVFSPRQAFAMITLVELVETLQRSFFRADIDLNSAIQTCLALAVDRQSDATSSLCRWHITGEKHTGTFGRQALPMVWDFSEVNVLSSSTGGFAGALAWVEKVVAANSVNTIPALVARASATSHSLPDDSVNAFVTDPPYYDAVPYAYLSDYFYVWLRRILGKTHSGLFASEAVPKDEEIVVDRRHELSQSNKDVAFYERELTKAFAEGQRTLRPDGIGTIVFASKTTASWEAIIQAIVDSGWIITGSWPIDTEMEARVAAQGQARLASSIHLVCRPRENAEGSVGENAIGDWRDVLSALPVRIHEWMPRLADEGVVGADAIFACIGPALEIFSKYNRVERASGEAVTLREYLEQVWAAVSKEALSMIFEGADATGFEEDARLTAMWLWTLGAGGNGDLTTEDAEATEDDDDEDKGKKGKLTGGFLLEYDAARKIAQGLGAHLEALHSLVEVKGDKARLRPVAERAAWLFGKPENDQKVEKKKDRLRAKKAQLTMFEPSPEEIHEQAVLDGLAVEKVGDTTLDRVHQAMLLFGNGRGDALKRFLVDDGAGRDAKFWKLAQALVALYPQGTEERRWAEGLQARKKGLGL